MDLDGVPENNGGTRCKMVACVWLTYFLSLLLRRWIIQQIDMLFEWAVVNGVCEFHQSLLRM